MAVGLPGTVCAVEADMHHPGLAESLAGSMLASVEQDRNACINVQDNLWLAQPCSLFDPNEELVDTVWLRGRLSELRRNFDYSLIHAPAACLAQTIILGQFADGVILVIQAGKTRRVVAQTTLAILKAAKVVVLGTVLTDRTFPVPEKLYSRL
jgi:Mrp family chromosome partitioning ATPase